MSRYARMEAITRLEQSIAETETDITVEEARLRLRHGDNARLRGRALDKMRAHLALLRLQRRRLLSAQPQDA